VWVVLDPSLIGDGAVPAVRIGEQIQAALVLEVDTSTSPSGPTVGGGNGALEPVPAARPDAISPRHRVRGTGALHGKRIGVEGGGLFVLCEQPAPVPGQPFDAIGDLHLTTWLVPRTARTAWSVRAIVLHTAPVPIGEPDPVPEASPHPTESASRGARVMTATEYVAAVGTQQAAARGVWVRGGTPDDTAGNQHHVEQAVALGRDPVGTARRYLLDVEPA
jgi:hypothetical protein